MSFEEIMTGLKKKDYSPIYLLMGDEPYFIDQITDYILDKVLTEEERSFNQSVIYGNETSAGQIDNAARRFPMMAERQVVVVKEAQDVKDIDNLSFYASKPSNSTVLVLAYKYKTIAKNKKLYKEIEKHGVVLESKKLYDNQVQTWIKKFVEGKKYQIEPEATAMLNEFLGTELSKVANAISKLFLILPEGTKITPQHIEDNIGISKDYNNFELQKAIAQKDVLKANKIINYFEKNPKDNPALLTVISLFHYFSKILLYHCLKDKSTAASALSISPYFVKDYENAAKKYNAKKAVEIISILREYDLRTKGVDNVSASSGDLVREMVFKIMH